MDEKNSYVILANFLAVAAGNENFEWQPLRPGVEICRLYQSDTSERVVALLRYAPGASVPEHLHQGEELILVLSGSQADGNGLYPAGSIIVNLQNSSHRVSSENGCVVLAIWEKPNKFL